MKNMFIAFYGAIIAFIVILIGFTIHGRSIRQVELDNALKSAMENTMVSLLYEEEKPENADVWKEEFLQALAVQINSTSNLRVMFLKADMEKGLLSVKAELTWTHPIGTKGVVSSQMTALLEEYSD